MKSKGRTHLFLSSVILTAALVITAVLAVPTLSADSYADGKFPPTRDTNTDGTHIFAMGDCRAVATFSLYRQPGAAIAQGAGHYRGSWPQGYVIDSDAQMALMKSAVTNHLQKKGKADVFIMATINIGAAARSNCDGAVRAQIQPARIIRGWSAVYTHTYKSGKTVTKKVRPRVFCTSLIPEEGVSPANYNNCLKAALKEKANKGIRYVAISAGSGYAPDGIHLGEAGARSVWAGMHRASGHVNGKAVIQKAAVKKNGSITRVCKLCGHVTTRTILRPTRYYLSKKKYTANGKARKPAVTIKNKKGKTIARKYYRVTYKNNIKAGTAHVIITFKGRYSGKKILKFKIVAPPEPEPVDPEPVTPDPADPDPVDPDPVTPDPANPDPGTSTPGNSDDPAGSQ